MRNNSIHKKCNKGKGLFELREEHIMNLRARLDIAGFKAVESDRSTISFFLNQEFNMAGIREVVRGRSNMITFFSPSSFV